MRFEFRLNKTIPMAAALLAAMFIATGTASATTVPAALFSDNAVLQASREVPVWGRDEPGQVVKVTLGQAVATGKSGADGRWEVKLPALKAGDTPLEMTIAGSSTVTIKNVLVGEVWLGSGQSNMAMPVDWGVFGKWGSPECTKAVSEVNYPKLRMFKVSERLAGELAPEDVKGTWQVCTPATILKWSAAGFFFSLNLQKSLGGTPVGFINSSVGGTQIAPWISRKTNLQLNPPQNSFNEQQWDLSAMKVGEFDKQLAAWEESAAKAKAAGIAAPPPPKRNVAPWPGCFYNGMIAPLIPYAIRGMVWYQGESNAGARTSQESYAKLLEALVKTWREGWREGDIPFIIVQLPNFSAPGGYVSPNSKEVQADPVELDAHWPPIREAQRLTAATVPNSGLLVAIDIGEPKNIHPLNKAELGKRMAALAMNMTYGKKEVASGPLFAGCEFKGGSAVVKFTSVGGGLAARDGGVAAGFAIAGRDSKFVWAKAVISGDTVVLNADGVKEPVAVRYSWAENPVGNLVNKEGLPASPFSSDGKK